MRGRRWRPAAKIEEQHAMRKTKNGPYCFIWKLEHENARTLEYSTRLDSAWLEARLEEKILSSLTLDSQLFDP